MAWFRCLLFISIAAGFASLAEETKHWAYLPLTTHTPPVQGGLTWAQTPVDHFVLESLKRRGLSPAPPTDKRTLLRRVYYDLIGLPPTPEQLAAFLADPSPDAYRNTVEALLASPRYGERWARHWMDAAHFAETHGHDQDRIRTNAWPYRDYLVAALNADKPYARFIQEQIAGDVLFPTDPQATIALGFLAAGPWDESSLRDIREDTLDRQIGRYIDRDDVVTTVMQTFASTTVQCARCHDHKFDPVTQDDYYALQAVFAGVDRANRVYDADPGVHVKRQELMRLRRRVLAVDTNLLQSSAVQADVRAWEKRLATAPTPWTILSPRSFNATSGARLELQDDGSWLAAGAPADKDTYTLSAEVPGPALSAVRLEVLRDSRLPNSGPGRAENGNFHLSEFRAWIFEPHAKAGRRLPVRWATTDFEQKDWGIHKAIDGKEETAWGIDPQEGRSHTAVFEFEQPQKVAKGSTLVIELLQLHGRGHTLGRFRLATTDAPEPTGAIPEAVQLALARSDNARTLEEQSRLAAYVISGRVSRDLAKLPAPSLVYAAASDFEPDGGLRPSNGPRIVEVLRRGEITKPIHPAHPGTLACIVGLPSRFQVQDERDEGDRRAALARWLADPANSLTWRSIVNRVWHYHFGRGIVGTPNDFGKMGATPSHPELLDWLAIWFRDEAKGSLKQLHRMLVLSATYQQGNDNPDAMTAASTDAENTLLWRMNRRRLEAEPVRDSILMASGQLDLRMGGPSDQQFELQPGIHVTPKVDYGKFDLEGNAGHRRGIYRFLFRTLPDPFMDALDCPAGDQLAPTRSDSVTVQQALALWNNAFVARYAERFAESLQRTAPNLEAQVSLAFKRTLSRDPKPIELEQFVRYARESGLANSCRLLFNSNEFLFIN